MIKILQPTIFINNYMTQNIEVHSDSQDSSNQQHLPQEKKQSHKKITSYKYGKILIICMVIVALIFLIYFGYNGLQQIKEKDLENSIKNIKRIQIEYPIHQKIAASISQKTAEKVQNKSQSKEKEVRKEQNNFKKTQKQIKAQNQRLKKEALDKYYSIGLKEYYDSIQQQIKIARIQYKEGQEKSHYSYIVNNLDYKTSNLCIEQLKVLSQENENKKPNECLCIFKKNHSVQDLQSYLKEKSISHEVNISVIDSTYNFLTQYISPSSEWLVYICNFGNFHQIVLKTLYQNNEKSAYLFVPNSQSQVPQLLNISQEKHASILSKSILIFPSNMLKLIAPLNFAVQDVYTFEELAINPVFALLQMGNRIQIRKQIQIQENNENKNEIRTQFILSKLKSKENPHVCFIATNTDLKSNQQKQTLSYLENFQKEKKLSQQSLSLFLTLIYETSRNAQKVITKALNLLQLGVAIRIFLQYRKISLPLQAYRAAYGYCPEKSLMFSSRMDTIPIIGNIFTAVEQSSVCSNGQKWILIGNFISENNQTVILPAFGSLTHKDRDTYLNSFETHFLHAQIYCQKLMRSMRLQIVRWQQLQFYETEASFMIPMLERIGNNFSIASIPLYKFQSKRAMTQKQKLQLQGLAFRSKIKIDQKILIKPLQFSELNNHAFRRNAPNIIPKILHQIWLSNSSQISPARQAMIDTLRITNPTFKYKLWTWQNVTRQQFPITYDGILKFLQVEKKRKLNYKALVADLMRIQILYHQGGIYLDLKIEGKKSLQPFLKYEEFYLIANEQNMVNGLIGSIPGNRHFRRMLEDFFRPENLRAPKYHIYEMTGGTKLIEAYTKKQLYTQSMNFDQFILQGPRPCVRIPSTQPLEPGQKVFEGISAFKDKKKYKIYIPCKKDMDKYLELYDIFGRTYFPENPQFS